MSNNSVNKVPDELRHAARHATAAISELESGHNAMAMMHLRECITDATWSMYEIWVNQASLAQDKNSAN